MPKIGKDYKKTQKTIAFMKWLRGKMASEGIKQKELAAELGMTQQGLSNHIASHSPFDYAQLVIIFNYMNAEPEEIAKLMK